MGIESFSDDLSARFHFAKDPFELLEGAAAAVPARACLGGGIAIAVGDPSAGEHNGFVCRNPGEGDRNCECCLHRVDQLENAGAFPESPALASVVGTASLNGGVRVVGDERHFRQSWRQSSPNATY